MGRAKGWLTGALKYTNAVVGNMDRPWSIPLAVAQESLEIAEGIKVDSRLEIIETSVADIDEVIASVQTQYANRDEMLERITDAITSLRDELEQKILGSVSSLDQSVVRSLEGFSIADPQSVAELKAIQKDFRVVTLPQMYGKGLEAVLSNSFLDKEFIERESGNYDSDCIHIKGFENGNPGVYQISLKDFAMLFSAQDHGKRKDLQEIPTKSTSLVVDASELLTNTERSVGKKVQIVVPEIRREGPSFTSDTSNDIDSENMLWHEYFRLLKYEDPEKDQYEITRDTNLNIVRKPSLKVSYEGRAVVFGANHIKSDLSSSFKERWRDHQHTRDVKGVVLSDDHTLALSYSSNESLIWHIDWDKKDAQVVNKFDPITTNVLSFSNGMIFQKTTGMYNRKRYSFCDLEGNIVFELTDFDSEVSHKLNLIQPIHNNSLFFFYGISENVDIVDIDKNKLDHYQAPINPHFADFSSVVTENLVTPNADGSKIIIQTAGEADVPTMIYSFNDGNIDILDSVNVTLPNYRRIVDISSDKSLALVSFGSKSNYLTDSFHLYQLVDSETGERPSGDDIPNLRILSSGDAKVQIRKDLTREIEGIPFFVPYSSAIQFNIGNDPHITGHLKYKLEKYSPFGKVMKKWFGKK